MSMPSSYRPAMLLAVSAFFCFAVLNACVKRLGMAGYDAFQIAFFNSLVSFVGLGAWLVWRLTHGGGVAAWIDSLRRMPVPWLTGYLVLALTACICLFNAFGHGVFPIISAIVAASPLLVAIFSFLFLKESLSVRQTILIIAGCIGVLIVARPMGVSTGWPVYMALAGVAAYAGTLTMVRARHGRVDVIALTMCMFASIIAVMPFLMDLRPVAAADAVYFLMGGAADAAGLVLIYSALMRAPAAIVSPFEYSAILWAAIFGYVIWGEWPDALSWLGIAVIVIAGLLFVRTEKSA